MKRFVKLIGIALCSNVVIACTPSSRNGAAVAKISVTEQPTKYYYVEGEDFDPTGMKIMVTYTNKYEEVLPDDAYTILNGTSLEASKATTKVTIQYETAKTTLPIKVLTKGNALEYSVENTPIYEGSTVKGNTYMFLGSSVTLGMEAENESMADFYGKIYQCNVIKEAVSGTKIGYDDPVHGKSYLTRLNEYLNGKNKVDSLDGFIVQLSTNDAQLSAEQKGDITAKEITSGFDLSTTYGALESIITTIKKTYNCPIYIYTGSYFESEEYSEMVNKMDAFVEKYGITLIDLYRDSEFNDITIHSRNLYMADDIHPTRAGYRDWWLDKFVEAIGGQE